MLISIVLPCFNEEGNVLTLYNRIAAVMASQSFRCEMLFVNDGSTDGTQEIIDSLCRQDERVTVLELSRNFGHQAAISAGIDHASGDAIIMMDADLQHPPELILQLLEKWQEGYDVVYTVRSDAEETSPFKKTTAAFFYKLINLISDINLSENAADFRLIDRKVALQLRTLKESNKFIRGLISWVGFRQYAISYQADARLSGRSKYSLWKMIRFAFDGITSFSAFPLHVSTILGVLVSCLSFLYAAYAVYIRLFTDTALPGWTSVLVAVLFLGGVQLLSLGVVGEYLNRIYTETKSRPSYIVRKKRTHCAEKRLEMESRL